MSDSIIFISRNRVREGMLDEFKNYYLASLSPTQINKPGTLVQLAYLNEDSTRVDIVRIFPNAEALDSQLQGAEARSKVTYRYIEPTGIEIYGSPSSFTLEMLKKVAGSGIPVSIYPQFIGGFVRPGSG